MADHKLAEPPISMLNDDVIDRGAVAAIHGDIELQTHDETTVVRTVTKPHGFRFDNDDATLRRLGKRPLLTRSFGFTCILGLSCSALSSWEAILNTSVPALLEGGPGAVVWAFIIGWIGTISVTATLGGMSSMAPTGTAGGQYRWIAMLSPKRYVSFLSYSAAWLTVLNWQALSIASAYGSATVLQGTVVLARPSYVPQAWHTILTMWG